MSRLSKDREQKLLTAVEKTAEFVNNGMRPTDAIVKVAKESQLHHTEIPLVVHAYNTGRTNEQRTSGNDPLEKAAEFELASAADVLDAVYPDNVKTAAQIATDEAVAVEYSYGPGPMLSRKRLAEKLAAAPVSPVIRTKAAEAVAPRDSVRSDILASGARQRSGQMLDELRRKTASAFDQLQAAMDDMQTYFRRPDASTIPVVKEAVLLYHGGIGQRLLDELVACNPKLGKQATDNRTVGMHSEPMQKFATIMSRLEAWALAKHAYETAVATKTAEAGQPDRPFIDLDATETPLSDVEKVAFIDPLRTMATWSLAGNAAGNVADRLKPPNNNSAVAGVVDSLNDPSHEMKLRGISTQSMLHDFMLHDPVISGYDPEEVAGSYNDIVQISPSVGDQRMLIQALLRKRLQQGMLDTFEQSQLLDMEDKLRRQASPMSTGRSSDGLGS